MTLDDTKAFIVACYCCQTIAEVGQKTGLTDRQVSDRKKHLERMGVPLPRMKKANGPKPGTKHLTIMDYYALKLFAMEQQELARRLAEIQRAKQEADKYRKHAG